MSEDKSEIDVFTGNFIRLTYWPEYEENENGTQIMLEFGTTSIAMNHGEFTELVKAIDIAKNVIPITTSVNHEGKQDG